MSSVLELTMLLCFGASWPFSIAKSCRSRTSAGKSIVFLWALILGYAVGIVNKVVFNFNYVTFFYAANLLMVATDAALWYRNRALDMKRRTEASNADKLPKPE